MRMGRGRTGPAAQHYTEFQRLVGPGPERVEPHGSLAVHRQPAGHQEALEMQDPQAGNLASCVLDVIVSDDAPGTWCDGRIPGMGEAFEEDGLPAARGMCAVVLTDEGQSMTLPIGEE